MQLTIFSVHFVVKSTGTRGTDIDNVQKFVAEIISQYVQRKIEAISCCVCGYVCSMCVDMCVVCVWICVVVVRDMCVVVMCSERVRVYG